MCCALPSNSRLESTPMQHYTHLSPEERYTIQAERRRSASVYSIARLLNRKPSTIYRELQRNTGLRGYRPKQAQAKADARRVTHLSSLSSFAWSFIKHLLLMQWSPEQISYTLKANGWDGVPSHEWIYQFIYADKQKGGVLYQNLRRQKTYRKRGFSGNDRRGQIKNKVSIHERLLVIEARTRLGDFEGDTIIGGHHKGAVLTLIEQKSLYTLMTALPSKHAKATIDACVAWSKWRSMRSLTTDNGKEFSDHERLSALGTPVYFADPYQSNQRARNENNNGLIRQYLPKGTPLDKVTRAEIARIQDLLNHRPRKTLGWLTPAQVFAGISSVALQI